MKLDLLKYDKNGCTDLIPVWCYKCTGGSATGKTYTLMGNNKGKGKMVYIEPREISTGARFRYECVVCEYAFNYTKTYVSKYAIK